MLSTLMLYKAAAIWSMQAMPIGLSVQQAVPSDSYLVPFLNHRDTDFAHLGAPIYIVFKVFLDLFSPYPFTLG